MSTPDLPTGFTECEYLENSGPQYINTKILPTGSMCVTTDMLYIDWDFINPVWGSTVGYWPGKYELGFTPYYNGGWGAPGRYRYGTTEKYFTGRGEVQKQHELNRRYHYVFDKNNVYRDGQRLRYMDDKTLETVEEIPEQTFVGTRPILVFAAYWYADGWVYSGTSVRFYSFNIKDNGEELINLIPVLDKNGVPCMYDTVSKTCFRNKGKGTFGYKIKNSDIVVAPKST